MPIFPPEGRTFLTQRVKILASVWIPGREFWKKMLANRYFGFNKALGRKRRFNNWFMSDLCAFEYTLHVFHEIPETPENHAAPLLRMNA